MDHMPPSELNPVRKGFERTLIEDVLAAYAIDQDRRDETSRRNVVRTTFAAIEGLTWLMREQVRSVAASLGHLSPLADMAMREQNYTVTENGEILEQTRYVTLTASIRLTVKQAVILNNALQVDFATAGWSNLRQALTIRHRITHPKTQADLAISTDDLEIVRIGFSWLLAVMTDVMTATLSAHATFNMEMRNLLEALKRGDPDALNEYQSVIRDMESE